MAYVRKTQDEYTLQGFYGNYVWEDLTTEETLKEIRARRKEYRKNEGGQYRIVKRRVPIEVKA